MDIREITDPQAWDAFLVDQQWSPFLQSFAMGQVYTDIGQTCVRLGAYDGATLVGICMGHMVPARRGRHLSVPYGPVVAPNVNIDVVTRALIQALTDYARQQKAWFLRISPFLPYDRAQWFCGVAHAKPAPMHLLAEHLWVLPLSGRTEADLLAGMRKTTRNLVRRAEREGVTIRRSQNPVQDLDHFLRLHDETRKRHQFTPYTTHFFRAQVERFAAHGNVSVYMAEHQGNVISSSIHMHFGGETSYHHGASASAYARIPASHLLQWTAIRDALQRGDKMYNFWGIAPEHHTPKHPFAGITTFKTGFGGERLTLMPCVDVPLSPAYHATRALEVLRRLKRGF